MANELTGVIFGVDVSKDSLDICDWSTGRICRVANSTQGIQAWLETLDGPAHIALEPTSNYHLQVLAAICQRGHQAYLVNPRQLHHYRVSVGLRHKSDPHDAWLLARFLAHESAQLRVYQVPDARARQLWTLVKRRGTLVESRKKVQQSLRDAGLSCTGLLTQFAQVLARIDRRIEQLLADLGWRDVYEHCRSIPGIGAVTGAALVAAYHRGVFASADAFVAYLGLDIRLRQSGRLRGRRTLTKHGEPELRRVLFCASHAARHEPRFKAYLQRQLAKGLSKTAARVILARKLVRIAFALMSNHQAYRTAAGTG